MRRRRRARAAMFASSWWICRDAAPTVPDSDEMRPLPAEILFCSWPTLAALATGELEVRRAAAADPSTATASKAQVALVNGLRLNIVVVRGIAVRANRAMALRPAASGGGHANTLVSFAASPDAKCKKTCNVQELRD